MRFTEKNMPKRAADVVFITCMNLESTIRWYCCAEDDVTWISHWDRPCQLTQELRVSLAPKARVRRGDTRRRSKGGEKAVVKVPNHRGTSKIRAY